MKALLLLVLSGGLLHAMAEQGAQYEYPRIANWQAAVQAGKAFGLEEDALAWAEQRLAKATEKSLPKRQKKDEAVGKLKHEKKAAKQGEANIRANERGKHNSFAHILKRYDKLLKQDRFWTAIVAMLERTEVREEVRQWARENLERTKWRLDEVAKAKNKLNLFVPTVLEYKGGKVI